jgi:hypothetical protein
MRVSDVEQTLPLSKSSNAIFLQCKTRAGGAGNMDKKKEKSPFLVFQEDFQTIRMHQAVYVDKTGFIYDLISNEHSTIPHFLSRPRRFGKTLLLDTIGNIFKGKRELFSGLNIEKSLGGAWETFPVIRLTMNTLPSDPAKFPDSLLENIQTCALDYKVNLKSNNPATAIATMIGTQSRMFEFSRTYDGTGLMHPNPRKNVVILIDEYDYPMFDNIGLDKNIEDIRRTLHDFYSSIIGSSPFLRFVLITGITKFKQLSVFSAMNNVQDISLDERYSTICGFTKEEIEIYFAKYLDPMLDGLKDKGEIGQNSTKTDLVKVLLDRYDGYSWDSEKRVLNPLSVLSSFDSRSFGNFWYNSGSSLLISNISQNKSNYFKVFDKDLTLCSPYPEMDLEDMIGTVVLMQAGYLTIDKIKNPGSNPEYFLKIPNNEVYESIRLEILKRTMVPLPEAGNHEKFLKKKYQNFLKAFGSRNEPECERFLSIILGGIVQYEDTGPKEFLFRSVLQLLIEFGNKRALPECPSDIGRSDLAVETPNGDIIVIEIKHKNPNPAHKDTVATHNITSTDKLIIYGKKSKYLIAKLEALISKAFSQLIKKNYVKKYLAEETDVYAAAVAIYGTSEVMVRFKKVVWKKR